MRLILSTLLLCGGLTRAAEPAPAPAPSPAAVPAVTPAPAVPGPADTARVATPAPAVSTARVLATVPADSGNDSAAAPAPTPPTGVLELRNPVLERLALSGTVQLKAFYHDFASDRDADKHLSLQLRRFKLGLEGSVTEHAGFRGEFLLDGANKSFGAEDAYLWWRASDIVGIKGGKLKRPFSQEALQSSKSLYTIERGELYHDFLANTTGYAYYDLGLLAYGGFADDGVQVGYEVGLFNGKQSEDGYAGQQDVKTDAGFFAKDLAARLTVSPMRALKLEAAVSTKAAEDKSDKNSFAYAVNTAYEIGADLKLGRLRLLGEVSMGDNHQGKDSLIIAGSSDFFAFYAAGVWREDYRGGRASELVLKMEGLDPDFGWKTGSGKANDGKFRYTAGCNYFFTPAISVMADYALLQPITKIPDEDRLRHSLDLMWRLSF
jgi:hypothetical protein